MKSIDRLIREEHAQDLAEYAMALAVITAAVVLIAQAIGGDVNTLWSRAQGPIEDVVNAL